MSSGALADLDGAFPRADQPADAAVRDPGARCWRCAARGAAGLDVDVVAVAWFLGTWLPFVALSLFWQRTELPLLHGDRDARHLPGAGPGVHATMDAALGARRLARARARRGGRALSVPADARSSASEPSMHVAAPAERAECACASLGGPAPRCAWRSCAPAALAALGVALSATVASGQTAAAVRRLDHRDARRRSTRWSRPTSTAASWAAARRRPTWPTSTARRTCSPRSRPTIARATLEAVQADRLSPVLAHRATAGTGRLRARARGLRRPVRDRARERARCARPRARTIGTLRDVGAGRRRLHQARGSRARRPDRHLRRRRCSSRSSAGASPSRQPAGPSVTLAGAAYAAETLTFNAFPAGTLDAVIALPAPHRGAGRARAAPRSPSPRSGGSPSASRCASTRWSSNYHNYVEVVHSETGAIVVVRIGLASDRRH